jgi:hypothetical protein
MKTALVTCGALAREVVTLRDTYGWDADVLALPALLHNRPEAIPAAVLARIGEARKEYARVIVIYGDCGTGGQLDALLKAQGIDRIPGPHCYEIYARRSFDDLMSEEPGTFFLTDYLLNSFHSLVIKQLGLDRFPQLRDEYFRNYKRVVYLAQRPEPSMRERAKRAAALLKLPLEILATGYGALEADLLELMKV